MKIIKHNWLLIVGLFFVIACNQQDDDENLTAQNVASEFAIASCQGNFKKALKHLLNTPDNQKNYADFQQKFNTQPSNIREGYKNSSLQNWKEEVTTKDSVYVYSYVNSYTQKTTSLKVVKTDKKWKVDFVYTIYGNL
jgi:hypothetical protein